jgi:ATP-binding cassette subfamily C (CFTR/MRP) protein 4
MISRLFKIKWKYIRIYIFPFFRFARDISIVDLMLSMCIFDIIVIGLISITIVVIIIAITPWLAIPTIICGFVFTFLRMIYIRTSRSIKRLEGTSK